jgi:K+-transporting ATPase KdpF subunit
MGPLSWLVQDTGLITLTALAVVLTFYLLYAMIYPERF